MREYVIDVAVCPAAGDDLGYTKFLTNLGRVLLKVDGSSDLTDTTPSLDGASVFKLHVCPKVGITAGYTEYVTDSSKVYKQINGSADVTEITPDLS